MNIVRVALAIPLKTTFDYLVPPQDFPSLQVGMRVMVPFGPHEKIGIIVELATTSEYQIEQLKTIKTVLDQQPIFDQKTWALLQWSANYYHHPLGDVLFQALPQKLRQGKDNQMQTETGYRLTEKGQQALSDGSLARSKKQLEALQRLSITTEQYTNTLKLSSTIKKNLLAKELIEEYDISTPITQWQTQKEQIIKTKNKLTLNKEQALAVNLMVFQQTFKVWLLQGITGSGKTEVYLQVIEEVVKQGKQVLVLVPEISLTPQTIRRFEARFNLPIDVLHSNLNDSQRLAVWQRSSLGQNAIVIGTRSALFTRFQHLGLIVLDEEHDQSFKQQEGWRYNARDLAVMLAQQHQIPIILGSATPSLESLNNVEQGKYQLLQLKQRAESQQKTNYRLLDLKRQRVYHGLSEQLLHLMQQHLSQGNQVMLFLNRRGFAPILMCHECGWIAECQHCDKPYTYHQHRSALHCHHCSAQVKLPHQCKNCGSTHLITSGIGTEQLEKSLIQHFPQYQISRLDRDTTTRKGQLEKHLEQINQGHSQILIGTQLLAKGHHFPNVTLVGIINIDNALFSLDFRAEERLAQIYTQVAGRTGRSEKAGEVVLQTYYPDHPLLQLLLNHGYSAFAQQALNQRQTMGLPPASYQALFKARSKQSDKAQNVLEQIAQKIMAFTQNPTFSSIQCLPPMPALQAKKAGFFRWQLLIQTPHRASLQKLLSVLELEIATLTSTNVHLTLDVDPYDFS
ncbi:primosomal protein N' [Mergibacter septicus]|uniref:Replication restart protein PriA n=1 Tax=Mergibacter septicus TaxID=221402 RepID=A0A8E3MHA5_9PAST|nr:primosomal protein N' [Mergibacter septicus]AWX15942.1 primosomal protein N' [Mergibacter septicus]QDJ15195.1 primosomal protein N' [Mergibacter septicus]WMR95436.1 primosomal protein N' [Mergibacter septicus]